MSGEKILLADDDPQILHMLTEFLESQGYEVTGAADGQQAMAALEAQEFALALLDLMFPGFSGLELLAYIKSRTPDTEVILFTGHAGLESAVQALRLGAYDYLLKTDLRLADLQAIVARALERRRLTRENRELTEHISKARDELAGRRAQELARVKLISETLGGPLTWDQLMRGLVNLIWDSLCPEVLGLEVRGKEDGLPLESYRRRPEVPDDGYRAFQALLKGQLGNRGPAPSPPGAPLPEMLWERVEVGNVTLVAGAGRLEPFNPEDVELFRVFILQGEAGIKNLVLFDRVKNMAIRDALTGLYNYGYFREALHHEMEKSYRYKAPLSLVFLDIDNFKLINDTLGHLQGDRVIRQVASILRDEVRQADLLCRYGGDEFVLLLSQTSSEQAMVMAERLRRLIAESAANRLEQGLRVTVSIGVAELAPGMGIDDLVQAADAAHYRAKQAGKNRICGPVAFLPPEDNSCEVDMLLPCS